MNIILLFHVNANINAGDITMQVFCLYRKDILELYLYTTHLIILANDILEKTQRKFVSRFYLLECHLMLNVSVVMS